MAKILRSETSLGRRESELRRELARTFWLRLAAWGPVAVLSILLAVTAVRRSSPWPLAGIPVLALLGLGRQLPFFQKDLVIAALIALSVVIIGLNIHFANKILGKRR